MLSYLGTLCRLHRNRKKPCQSEYCSYGSTALALNQTACSICCIRLVCPQLSCACVPRGHVGEALIETKKVLSRVCTRFIPSELGICVTLGHIQFQRFLDIGRTLVL